MHSAPQSYDTNGHYRHQQQNSMQNGHYRPHQPQQQQMTYHYPQNRSPMRSRGSANSKPPQIDTLTHSHSAHTKSQHQMPRMNHLRHSNPHQAIHNTNHRNQPINRNHTTVNRPTRTASYGSGFNDRHAHYRGATADSASGLRFNPMPQISEPRSDPNQYAQQQQQIRRSNPQIINSNHAPHTQQTKPRTQSVSTFNRRRGNDQLPAPNMHSMHKFQSNDSSIYSPDSIQSQPTPQRELKAPIHDMKKNKSFTLYHDQEVTPHKTKQSRSRTVTSIRGLKQGLQDPHNTHNRHRTHNAVSWNHAHHHNNNAEINQIMVFSPRNSKEMELPHNIGLTDYKMDMEQDYYNNNNKSQNTARRRAETAPAPPYYSFMRSVDENVEYMPRGQHANRPPVHLPASYLGSPVVYPPRPHSPQHVMHHHPQQNMSNHHHQMQFRKHQYSATHQQYTPDEEEESDSYSDTESDSDSGSASDSETLSQSQSESETRSSDESETAYDSDYIDSRSVSSRSRSDSRSVSSSHSSTTHSDSRSIKKKKKKRKRSSRRRRKKSSKKKQKRKRKSKRKRKESIKLRQSTTHNKQRTRQTLKDMHSQGSAYTLNDEDEHTPHVTTNGSVSSSHTAKECKASHLVLIEDNKIYEKTKKTAVLLRSILKRQILFIGLDDAMLDGIVDSMYAVQCPKNSCLMKQNENGDALFVIQSGKFIQIRNNKVIGTATAKSMVGEAALLYSQTRRASFKAQQESVAWALDRTEFMKVRQTILTKNIKSHSKKIKFLRKIALFEGMDRMDLIDIACAIRAILYRKGANIMTENEESTHFFIVYKGTCEAFEKNKRLSKYSAGHYFGATGIINKELRQCRVTATSDDVICYVLNAVEFSKFLSPTHDDNNDMQKPQHTAYFPLHPLDTKLDCALSDFKRIAQIGRGRFGDVFLVEHANTADKTYALKRMDKYEVTRASAVHHIRNERAILCSLCSPYCVSLYATYRDECNVYLLCEAVLGGQVFYLLKFNKRFPEKTARFYAACVVLALEHIHSRNVIFRDVKPQNLLVSRNGYIKLCDFGCAKERNESCTLCGTPEYLAPEVIQCAHESFTRDWWTLGVLIYEMVIGTVPFRDDVSVKMYEKILSSSVNFPNKIKMSRTGKDLVTSLLRKHPYKRLGSGAQGHEQIKNHKWFQAQFSWNKMMKQEVKPPYVPNIKSSKDVSNFERFEMTKQKTKQNNPINQMDPNLFAWCDEF